jgi:hypothetical protein
MPGYINSNLLTSLKTVAASTTGPPGPAGKDGKDGKDGSTPRKGVDYFDGVNGTNGHDGSPGTNGYTPIKNTDYFDGSPGSPGAKGDKGDKGNPGSDATVTKPAVESVLTGEISTHTHVSSGGLTQQQILRLL